MTGRAFAALLALGLAACSPSAATEDAGDLDAGRRDTGPRACGALPAPETPADCSTRQAGCPCANDLEIDCDLEGFSTWVCIDGVWERSFDTFYCSEGTCGSAPHIGCPCCESPDYCFPGTGKGVMCSQGRWRFFHDGPCWPPLRMDTGPPWSPDAGTDAGEELDADLAAATDG